QFQIGQVAEWSQSNPGDAHNVTVSGNYAYVMPGSQRFKGIEVFDIRNPARPLSAGGAAIMTNSGANAITSSSNFLYVAEGFGDRYSSTGRVEIFSIANPTNPAHLANVEFPGGARAVAISSNYAYVAAGNAGLQIIDISNPANPVRMGAAGTPAEALAL